MNIRITFSNGECFDVPSEVVARSRTSYYAEKDGFTEGSKNWNDEMEQSMNEFELCDWIGNSMDWVDVADYAVSVESNKKSYSDMWGHADFGII